MQITLLKPKDFIKALNDLNKLRDKKHSLDVISWLIDKDKLILSLFVDSGTIVNKSFDCIYQGNTLKLCTSLTSCLGLTCSSNDDIVSILLDDDTQSLIIINGTRGSTTSTKLLDVNKYYIAASKFMQPTDNIKYFNLTKIKQLLAGINVKDSHNMLGINVMENTLAIITDDGLNTSLKRCK